MPCSPALLVFERLVAFLVFLLLLLGAAALTRGNDLGLDLAPDAPEVACAACAPDFAPTPSGEDEGDDDKDEEREKDDDREKDEERRDKDEKGKGKGKR